MIKMRTFIEEPMFTQKWKELGFDDNDLYELEKQILYNPEAGVMMEGTGGIRKLRFAFEGKGKSKSTRVCYVDFAVFEVVHLLTVFPKDLQDNLTDMQKRILKTKVKELKEYDRRQRP